MKESRIFDIDKFLTLFSKKNKPIETKDIAQWLNINVRNIQIFASKFNIPYDRIHGRKYYIWNETTLFFFKIYYERYNDKKPKKYYIPKPKKVKTERDKITFTTIKDIVNEYCVFPSKNGITNLFTKGKPKTYDPKKALIRYIQIWSKKNNIPFEYHFGRKYYVIDNEKEEYILENIITERKWYLLNFNR